DRGRTHADETELAHRRRPAVSERPDRERDEVRPLAEVVAAPGELQPTQLRILEDLRQRPQPSAQPQGAHARRISWVGGREKGRDQLRSIREAMIPSVSRSHDIDTTFAVYEGGRSSIHRIPSAATSDGSQMEWSASGAFARNPSLATGTSM